MTLYRYLAFFVFCFFFVSCQSSVDEQKEIEIIKQTIADQQVAWNNFDIPAFMKAYWQSSDMSFVSKSGVVKGWDGMKERYEKNYPNQEAMGKLTFDLKEVKLTDANSAMVIGSWNLLRPEMGDIGGYFTLVLQKINGEWKIISDHTS
ncbi:Ketosteroid isomerase homolog [Spirosomataceae bacterium TFI 002]|nr:Ketosteroid isomerase homolog [Spirosomataceae bacterium TFI 002]